jgi:hypothetical protein
MPRTRDSCQAYVESFSNRIRCGESIGSFLRESKRYKKYYRQRYVGGDGEYTMSRDNPQSDAAAFGIVTVRPLLAAGHTRFAALAFLPAHSSSFSI